ncbi:MAG: AEC family transporter, partial [Rhodospirillales bacterium]|nr:AEC family transporter [Rhodospirillales bacterium]MCW8971175.1 AEC family transporter [Rhodospirillales bacterium]
MIQIVGALAPVFLLILTGYAIRRKGLLPDAFWSPAESLTYHVFFPALLVANIAKADLAGLSVAPMAGALICGVLIVTGFALWSKPLLRADNTVFTSFFQGTIRPNTYVGIAAAAALFGEAGLALTAIAIVFVVPLVNILSVTMLIRYRTKTEGEVERSGRALIVRELTRNPIVLACLLGGV